MVNILGKKLLFVTAHPDDESFLAAGTMMKNAQQGGQNFLVCATYGEKGKYHLEKPLDEKDLSSIRKKELIAVSKFLKVSKLYTSALPDGGLCDCPEDVCENIVKAVTKHKPDVVISFGPDGITGHLDHIEAGECAKEIAADWDIPFIAFTLSEKVAATSKEWMVKRRKNLSHYVKSFKHPKPTIKIPIESVVKLRALQFHKSQHDANTPFGNFPGYVIKEFLKAEYFAFDTTRNK